MNEELTARLNHDYPTFFDLDGDPRHTLMVFGFACGDGWYDAIDDLCRSIQTHLEINEPKYLVPDTEHTFKVVQVKEKFGTLRFYTSHGDEFIHACELLYGCCTEVICETCGEPGLIRKGGWYQCLCDEHAEGREGADPNDRGVWSHQDEMVETYVTTMEAMIDDAHGTGDGESTD